jgi:hypothetical protein
MGRPRTTRPATDGGFDAATEKQAEREIRGMEVRTIGPLKSTASAARRAAWERYEKDFFRLLNRLRTEARPSTQILEQMQQFREEQHPAPPARHTTTEVQD